MSTFHVPKKPMRIKSPMKRMPSSMSSRRKRPLQILPGGVAGGGARGDGEGGGVGGGGDGGG